MADNGLITSGALWLWDKYGEELVRKGWERFFKEWKKFSWVKAEKAYRKRLKELYGTTRLLGYSKPVDIEGIYTDIYIYRQLTSNRHLDYSDIESNYKDTNSLHASGRKRLHISNVISNGNRLFVVGKPGSGKTTLLKYLTLEACSGKLDKTPIFISLREWANSNIKLFDYIYQQFDICDFPNPRPFVTRLLKNGHAIVLLDGLDEVEASKHNHVISVIENFSRTFKNCIIITTCRIAAVDYVFTGFRYVEIADFSAMQIILFCKKWFKKDIQKSENFIAELKKEENSGLFELARTPLLLALLCLVFDETLMLPKRRVDLYKEAFDALLKKWDSTRGIIRDQIYQKMPPRRKEQMLSIIAMHNFKNQKNFITKNNIVKQIEKYMKNLPPTDIVNPAMLDGENVLNEIVSQHGLLVISAYDIYSFSHLTFQEYLVARNIVENIGNGSLDDLARYLCNNAWREVIIMVASLLDNADCLYRYFLPAQDEIIDQSVVLKDLVIWISNNSKSIDGMPIHISSLILFLTSLVMIRLRRVFIHNEIVTTLTLLVRQVYLLIQDRQNLVSVSLVRHLQGMMNSVASTDINVAKEYKNIKYILEYMNVDMNKFSVRSLDIVGLSDSVLAQYIKFVSLYVECLDVALVSDRKYYEAQLLKYKLNRISNLHYL